jgi:bacterioferritin-associated ferredoxin
MEEESFDPFDPFELYSLLRPRNVCICKAVSEEVIVKLIQEEGCRTFHDIVLRTGAATGCGSCSMAIKSILVRELRKIQNEV